MATISGYDSGSISTLFSSLNTGSGSSNTLSGLYGINVTDYTTIRNGSYGKLMKAYYSDKDLPISQSTSTAKDSSNVLARVENSAENLKEAADDLLTVGNKSVFNKVDIKDEDGNVKKDYDTDAIYKKVNAFVTKYNSMIESGGDSNTTGVLTAVSSMVNRTEQNSSLLSQIGISIDEDNKLTLDEDTFKKSDMTIAKSLFNGTGSYGYQISAQASMANFYAENEAAKANTYTSSGLYTYNYTTGEIYNSYT
ncbi:MAG: hypothetical protein ACI4DO_03885 [Roseburia sp.]